MGDGIPGSTGADEQWLARAVALAGNCPPSDTAFSVGAVIVAADGAVLAEGWSRQDGDRDHAEEAALRGLTRASGEAAVSVASLLAHATVYSSLEPCSSRASRSRSCSELIVAAGVRRVVMAWREPPLFVTGDGVSVLSAAGVEVVELPQFADAARAPNAHLAGGGDVVDLTPTEPVLLVVDGANVVGSVPDGWWRDRRGAALRLRDELVLVHREGLPGLEEPDVVLVVEGAARGVEPVDGVAVVSARGSGDDAIVDVVAEARAGGARRVVVATADRELISRVRALGADVVGPRSIHS